MVRLSLSSSITFLFLSLTGHALVFQRRVLSFSLLPYDDAVDVVVPTLDVWQRLHVDHVRVQIQSVAQLHVEGL